MKKYFLLVFMAAVTVITGCEKSFENFTPYNNNTIDSLWAAPNTGNFTRVIQLHENLTRSLMVDSFNLSVNSVIDFPENIRVEIPGNACQTITGTVLSGKAAIEIQLLKKKGDLIRFQKQTVSNGYLLESGGVVFVQISKNGSPLSLIPGRYIHISFRDPAPNPLMKGFVGVEPVNTASLTNFNWVQDDSAVIVRTSASQSPPGYEVYTNKLRWINCDYFIDTAEVKTRIALSMPAEFTNANTTTWIVYKNIRSVMQMDTDYPNRIWRKDRVPVNRAVIYVTISKRGDDYWLGAKEAVTSINQNVDIRPVKKSLQDLRNFLDGLL